MDKSIDQIFRCFPLIGDILKIIFQLHLDDKVKNTLRYHYRENFWRIFSAFPIAFFVCVCRLSLIRIYFNFFGKRVATFRQISLVPTVFKIEKKFFSFFVF
jgi:hypothetical protein